jgi:ABC-type amino acid transport substrate-binding protein
MDTMAIGALSTSGGITLPWDGNIAELWYGNADVQADSASGTGRAVMRTLAYQGPFELPSISRRIVEYRSFRSSPLYGDGENIAPGKFGAQNWTNTNGVTTASHVPLPYSYNQNLRQPSALVSI